MATTRSRTGSTKDKPQLSSITASPAASITYDFDNKDASTSPYRADVDPQANINYNNESRFSTLENSIASMATTMAAMQANMNQLIAMQLSKSNDPSSRSSVQETQSSTVETEIKVPSHVDSSAESTQASPKPSKIQSLVSGLSQLLAAFRFSPVRPDSASNGATVASSSPAKNTLAPLVQALATKLEPSTSVIPPTLDYYNMEWRLTPGFLTGEFFKG